MMRLLGERLLSAIPTLFFVILLAFLMMRLAPGGPFDMERQLPPEIEANLRAAYGLDKPLPEQFLDYIGGVVRGDFGPSFKYKDFSVTELIADGLPVSAQLGFQALGLAILLGVPLGIIAALNRNTRTDAAVMGVAMTGIAVPNFVVAPILTLIFGLWLAWLPVSGWNDGAWQNLVLPTVALALPQVAYIARLMRGSMIETMRQNHIRTARAKGLPITQVVLKHALQPALLPVVSYLGPAAAAMLTGSVVVETIFGLPGIGRHFVQGAINRDYTLVLGVVIVYAAILILFNLLVDLAYGVLDPRVRAGQAAGR
jgi:oligopeptide transport system permease protein